MRTRAHAHARSCARALVRMCAHAHARSCARSLAHADAHPRQAAHSRSAARAASAAWLARACVQRSARAFRVHLGVVEQVRLVHQLERPHEQSLGRQAAHEAAALRAHADRVTQDEERARCENRLRREGPNDKCWVGQPAQRHQLVARARERHGSELESRRPLQRHLRHHVRVAVHGDDGLERALGARKQPCLRARRHQGDAVRRVARVPYGLVGCQQLVRLRKLQLLAGDADALLGCLKGEMRRARPKSRLRAQNGGRHGAAAGGTTTRGGLRC